MSIMCIDLRYIINIYYQIRSVYCPIYTLLSRLHYYCVTDIWHVVAHSQHSYLPPAGIPVDELLLLQGLGWLTAFGLYIATHVMSRPYERKLISKPDAGGGNFPFLDCLFPSASESGEQP